MRPAALEQPPGTLGQGSVQEDATGEGPDKRPAAGHGSGRSLGRKRLEGS